ncbi:hypothetical protein, partial [Sphingomonas sp. ABOLG]|uniref:hypothetical protein n=1 Tax=Sphingomonas sp. ABOLG TaxID=1985880 RepID=UPI0019D04D35
ASHNAYAAMKLVFNVSQTQILELAPILFATVAARALQIMVEMRAGQDHVGGSNDPRREAAAKLQALTAIGAPHTVLSIPPAPVPEMSDRLQVRPLAPFAALSGALETHPLR